MFVDPNPTSHTLGDVPGRAFSWAIVNAANMRRSSSDSACKVEHSAQRRRFDVLAARRRRAEDGPRACGLRMDSLHPKGWGAEERVHAADCLVEGRSLPQALPPKDGDGGACQCRST